MADTLTVRVNADGPHSVSADAASFATTGSFALALDNEGSPAHVHVKLDDALRRAASVTDSNHYVDRNATTVVAVTVADRPRPVSGTLTVLAGYGSESVEVSVRIEEPSETSEGVAVGEDLAQKQSRETDASPETLLVPGAVAAAGVLSAALALSFLHGLVALFVAGVALVGGLAMAGFLLRAT
ncbi:DUF2627 domain-containing protein [Salarchaeum sp. JOR-1]|uniref:DUF2627 domain-containing protein n=1 Tax=Salarchaeum sp. JOR-1 TaxID=2599399 RepID=UPI0011987571|nr:DUF2627 domain-containing protein [Salarchaeum sp. JOR-1]QDX41282.1 DUF2627 domain-containing protein [Salarchaeum sp. JOR-1]